MSISFDSKKTAGKTTTIVEILKGKSMLTPDAPEGEIYNYLNIWVGNSGFAISNNTENAVICFKVERAWIQDKKIDNSSITLNRYSGKKWEQSPTSLKREDDKYLYFTAKTPGFSPFAITGKTTVTETGTEIQSKPNTQDFEQNSTVLNIEQTSEQKENTDISEKRNTKTPEFEITSGVICLLGIFLYKRM